MANSNNVLYGTSSGQGFSTLALACNNSTAPVAQGDLLYLDTTNHIVKPLDSDAHAATFVGMALQPSAINSSLDASVQSKIACAVGGGCVALLKTTAADSYTMGTAVYAGADAQTVTVVAGSNLIGYVAEGPVTGASGVYVKVLLKGKIF